MAVQSKGRVEIGTKKILGREVVIQASSEGSWWILLDGDLLARNDSLERAEVAAKKKLAVARVKVEVPFFTADGEEILMAVDPGFARAVRLHVEEDGPLLMAVAKCGDPALWDTVAATPAVHALARAGKLHDARKRSIAQARALLLAGVEAGS